MIRLTLLNGKHWYVNPDHIVGIKSGHKYGSAIESDHQTGIEHTIDVTQVQESPEEVARKVLEWRLLISKYDSLRNAIAQEWGKGSQEQLICEVELVKMSLYKLAGLEEPT